MSGGVRVAIINQLQGGGATTAAKELLEWGPGQGVHATYFPRGERAESRATLWRELDAFAPDVVHLHCWYQSWEYDLISELASRWPVVFTAHDPYVVNQYGIECWECFRNALCIGCPGLGTLRRWRPNYRILERLAKRRVNRALDVHLVCPSEWMRRRLSRSEWGKRPTSVIPYSVDTDRYTRDAPRRARVGLPEAGPVALFVGNMYSPDDHRKGLPDLLAAFGAVRELVPTATLAIAGRVEGVAPPGGALVLGEVDADRLVGLYQASDVFVLPSHGDNLPVTVLEAMAAGLPVIGTRVGGIPEQVVEGETGLLVGRGDRPSLSDALAMLLSDPDRSAAMGQAGRARCQERFSRAVSGELHAEVYRRVASKTA